MNKDDLMPLNKAASLLPAVRGSKPPHVMTLYRWASTGLKSRSGQRVVLETKWLGGTKMVSLAAVEQFCAALDDVDYVPISPARKRLENAMSKQADEAMECLRQAGMI